jgi:hypothetical protein
MPSWLRLHGSPLSVVVSRAAPENAGNFFRTDNNKQTNKQQTKEHHHEPRQ